jgi:hypothetical protein
MGNESFDLIALCEEILDDAEVTAAEVRRLGDWIAAHEEVRRTWPGAVLAAPLQEALLDDKVNKAELRRVAVLLRRIQKEWVKRREEAVQQATMAKAASAASGMDLSTALLPPIAVTILVRSHSDNAITYEVDLSGPSCSCPDWKGARSHLPKGSPSRCCKHILDAFGRVEPPEGWPGWLGAFLEQGWKSHPARRWFVIRVESSFCLASVGGNDWSDVFLVVADRYQRFGYSVAERRWSYGQAPSEAAEVERAILSALSATEIVDGRSAGLLGRLPGR